MFVYEERMFVYGERMFVYVTKIPTIIDPVVIG